MASLVPKGHDTLGGTALTFHITNWRHNAGLIPIRQRALAVANGLTFVIPEARVPVGHPPEQVWIPFPAYVANLDVVDLGPSPPNNFGMVPLPPVRTIPMVLVIAGQPIAGYFIRWYHEFYEQHTHVDGQPDFLYYYPRERVDGHYAPPTLIEGGQHRVIENLHFGTQINQYRRAKQRLKYIFTWPSHATFGCTKGSSTRSSGWAPSLSKAGVPTPR